MGLDPGSTCSWMWFARGLGLIRARDSVLDVWFGLDLDLGLELCHGLWVLFLPYALSGLVLFYLCFAYSSLLLCSPGLTSGVSLG